MTSLLHPSSDNYKPGRPLVAAARMLTSANAYGTTLLIWALDHFGMEMLDWHPTALALDIEQEVGVTMAPGNFDRLMAAIAVVTTDQFFKDLPSFIQLTNVLAGSEADPDNFDKADACECAWAITEALLLSPPDQDDQAPFCDDIRHYLTHVLKDEGFVTPPDVLRIAIDADFSAQVRYDFSDSPELFGAIHQVQQEKTQEINAVIRSGLAELLSQLQALSLQNGSVTDLEKRLSATLHQGEQGDA